MVTELNEAELNELNSSWTQFDQQSARLQALLLGQAIMRNDGLLRSRLIEKLGKTFGQSEEELICVGSRLLGFSGISRSAKHHSITMIIDDMEMELDRIEDDERRAMAAGRPVDSEISDTVLQLGLVPANAWHAFFREMLSSDPPGNGIWRSILADAFERLIRGDKPVLFQPTTRYQRGRPLELDHVKRLAVLHVYFEAGKGKGVNASRRMIAEAIGVGFETLKTWSDALRKNPDDRNAMGMRSPSRAHWTQIQEPNTCRIREY